MAKSSDEVRTEFDDAVTMTAAQLRDWLKTEESASVGQNSGDGESTGHASGRRIVKILQKARTDVTDADVDHMRRVVSYVRRHLAQRPDGDVTATPWRYSLLTGATTHSRTERPTTQVRPQREGTTR